MNRTRPFVAIVCGMALFFAVVPVTSGADSLEGFDPQIAEAISSFQPFWTPPDNELKGIRVIIDAAGGNSSTADARNRDDLCLWTASHLYHLVRIADGFPASKRPDDRPATQPFDAESSGAGRTYAVRISVGKSRNPAVAPASDDERAKQLAQAMAQSGFVLEKENESSGATGTAIFVYLPEVNAREARINGIPAHRAWAEQIYRGLAAYAARQSPVAASAETDAAANEPPVVPFYPKSPPTTALRRSSSVIWNEGPLPPARAKWFCDLYIKQTFSDRTNVAFYPDVKTEGDTVLIGGTTNHTALLHTLETALRSAGVKNVRSEMRLLPEEGRLDPDRWFGTCVAPMSLAFGKPADNGSLQTQLLYGEPVYLLDKQDGFYLVQGGDGYCGWVREAGIRPLSREEFREYTNLTPAVLTEDVATETGRIVRGARVRAVARENGNLRIALPDGKQLSIPAQSARLIDDAETCKARAKSALDLLHVPYLFAGRSSVGLDCSGLVGSICDQYGCVLPRDAAQQFVTGSLVATRWYPEGLRAGDRIYFINETGKIFHTGLSLGGSYFVHSSPPGVQISSLNDGDRLYREHWDIHFLGARR